MPGTNAVEEVELVIDDVGGGGGKPPDARYFGGDDDEEGDRKPHPPGSASSERRYSTAIVLAMVSIFMFFMDINSPALNPFCEHRHPFVKQLHDGTGATAPRARSSRISQAVAGNHGPRRALSVGAVGRLAPARKPGRLRRNKSGQQFLLYLHRLAWPASSRWNLCAYLRFSEQIRKDENLSFRRGGSDYSLLALHGCVVGLSVCLAVLREITSDLAEDHFRKSISREKNL